MWTDPPITDEWWFPLYEKLVELIDGDGNTVEAFTYCATNIDEGFQPFRWYKDHVLAGAREAQLPPEYIAKIEAIEALQDPNEQRAVRERSLYR